MPKRKTPDHPSDFRAEFLAAYEKKRRSIRTGVKVQFLECNRPAEEVGMAFRTSGRHYVTVYVDNQTRVTGSIIRDCNPQRGLVVMRYWARAISAERLLAAVLMTIGEAKGIDDVKLEDTMKQRLREVWDQACLEVTVTF